MPEHTTTIQLRRLSKRLILLVGLCLALPQFAVAAELTQQQAIDRALATVGGDSKVLGVREMKNDAGVRVYAVKVLTNGRVRVIRIPIDN